MTLENMIQNHTTLLGKLSALVTSKQNATPEGRALFTQMNNRATELEQDIIALRGIENKQNRSTQHSINDKLDRLVAPKIETNDAETRSINAAWSKYLRTGETRDLTTISSSAGALIPEEYQCKLYEQAKYYAPLLNYVDMKIDDGVRPTNWVVVNDTANGFAIVAEATSSASTSGDSVFTRDGSVSDNLVSRITASFQLEQDSFDFDQFVSSVIAPRIGRSIEAAVTNGKDFYGTALTNSPTGGLLASLSAAGTVTTPGSAPTYANLATLYGSVDPSYRIAGRFMAHSTVHDALAAVLDSTGRPLYKVNAAGNLVLVKDAELLINQAMPALSSTAGTAQVTFGDYSKAYGVAFSGSRVKRVIDMPGYAENMLAAYLCYFRLAGVVLVPNAAKVLNA